MYYILDTETASLHGGVVEIAWLEVDSDLNILAEHCYRVNPERPIESGAQAIHGISDADVADCQTLAEIAKLIPAPIVLIAHNSQFDARMISPAIAVKSQLCTLALSRQYVKGVSRHKLEVLQAELSLPKQTSHTALGDVHTVRDLLLHILPLTGVDLPTLVDRADAPRMLTHMQFGKYAGLPMLQVPRSYRDWLLEQGELDKHLKYTLTRLKDL